VLELTSYTEDMRARGLIRSRSSWTPGTCADSPGGLAVRLGIRAGGRVLHIRRLRLADGEPMSIDSAYLAARRFPGLRRHLRRNPSLYGTLADRYGTELAETQETIETVLAGPQDASLLGVDVGFPAADQPPQLRRRRLPGRVGPVLIGATGTSWSPASAARAPDAAS
jgi:GntR family transcriptional regulator